MAASFDVGRRSAAIHRVHRAAYYYPPIFRVRVRNDRSAERDAGLGTKPVAGLLAASGLPSARRRHACPS